MSRFKLTVLLCSGLLALSRPVSAGEGEKPGVPTRRGVPLTPDRPAAVEDEGSNKDEAPETRARREGLQANIAKFPLVKLNTEVARVHFETLDLKKTLTVVDGVKYYAFRFRTPDEVGDLVWSFLTPGRPHEWYILAAAGTMHGFDTFFYSSLPRDVPGLGKTGRSFIVQELSRSFLKSNSEYIIWFTISDGTQPPPYPVSLNMFVERDQGPSDIFPMLFQEDEEASPR